MASSWFNPIKFGGKTGANKRHDLFQIAVWSCVFSLPVLRSPKCWSSNASALGCWRRGKGARDRQFPNCGFARLSSTYSLLGPLDHDLSSLLSALVIDLVLWVIPSSLSVGWCIWKYTKPNLSAVEEPSEAVSPFGSLLPPQLPVYSACLPPHSRSPICKRTHLGASWLSSLLIGSRFLY